MLSAERRAEMLSTVAFTAVSLEASKSTVFVTATFVVVTSGDTGTDSTPAALEAASRDDPSVPLEAAAVKEASIADNAPSIAEASLSSSNKMR